MGRSTPAAKKAARPPKGKTTSAKRQSIDWDAVERDYRTGKFTDGELSTKHKVPRETIVRHRKADQKRDPDSWQKDLSDHIRQATNALLVKDLVDEHVTADHRNVTQTVLIAAEVNKRVIQGHRSDIKATRDLAMELLAEVRLTTHSQEELTQLARIASEGLKPEELLAVRSALNDLLRLHSRVSSIHKLSDTLKKLQELERAAHAIAPGDAGIDPKAPPKPPTGVGDQPGDVYRWLLNQTGSGA